MLIFPDINPIALQLGPFPIRWYGLMYMVSFLSCWGLLLWRTREQQKTWSRELIGDLIFYIALGVIIGGRLGYMFLYYPGSILADPLVLLKTWEGGMSFHGGLVGVLASMWLFAKRRQRAYLQVTDLIAPLVPIGLFFGRLGNFINGELWGRATDVSWAMVFPMVDSVPRHPSALYEALGEGLLLLLICQWYANKPRLPGQVSACFLIGYAVIRFGLEFTRQPDVQLGFIAFNWLTMGQLISVPMLAIGVGLMVFAHKQKRTSCNNT